MTITDTTPARTVVAPAAYVAHAGQWSAELMPGVRPAPVRGSGTTCTTRPTGAPAAVPPAGRFTITRRLDLRHVGPVDVTISGEWHGDPASPAVVVAGGISADRHVSASSTYANAGWWQALAGPHRALDPTRQRLVAIDWIGVDGDLDVPIDTADQAAAIVAALDHLGIAKAAAFVGASYGGMVGLQLAAEHADRIGRLVVISAAHRPHPYASAWRGIQRRILALGRANGAESDALSLARQLAMLSYRTPSEFGERFDQAATIDDSVVTCAADPYLEACGTRFAETFDPTGWLRLSESIDLHRLDPADVTVATTAIAVAEDRLVPCADVAGLVAGLGGRGELQVIRSPYGHDAFLKEPQAVGRLVRQSLRGIDTEGAAA